MTHLRPRSIGEIFDRGFTVFIKTFWRSAAILAVVAILSGAGAFGFFEGPTAMRTTIQIAALVALLPVLLIVATAFYALYGAEAQGEPIGTRRALETGVRRSLPALAVMLLAILPVGVEAAIVVATGYMAGDLISRAHLPMVMNVILSLVLGIPFVAGAAFLYGLTNTTLNVALSACVAERLGPITSIGRAVTRCARHDRLWPAAAIGFAGVAMSFAISMVVMLAQVSVYEFAGAPGNMGIPIAIFVVQQTLNALLTALTIAWASVYSLDARIRLEGLDLQAEANRIASAQMASASI